MDNIFLFTPSPTLDYLILFVVGLIIIAWSSRWVGVRNIIKGWPILNIRYWLGDDYHKWIVNVIYDLVNYNDPNDLLYLKKEIIKASQDSKDAQWVGVRNIIKGWPILNIRLMMIGLKICWLF